MSVRRALFHCGFSRLSPKDPARAPDVPAREKDTLDMPNVSVVVLCYKAGKSVPAFVARVRQALEKVSDDWEIVLVGNYNRGEEKSDPTPEYVRGEAESDPRVRAVVMPKEGMMGWDARTGLAAATGDVIIFIDGDNQMPPEDVEAVYKKLVEEKLDMAMTYRRVRQDSLVRRLNSKAYNMLFRCLFPGIQARDVNSKPKAMTRALYEKLELTADDWFLDAEIMIQARRHRAKIGQIPTVFRASSDRKSFVRFDAVLEFVKNLVRHRWREFFAKRA